MENYPPLRDVFTPTSPSLVALAKPVVVPLGPPTEEELRESEVRLRAVTYYHFCWAILRERLGCLKSQPFHLRRAVAFAAVVCDLARQLRPHRILLPLNGQSEVFLEEALDEAVHGAFSRPFRKERWRVVKPYLHEITDPVRNRDAQEVLTVLTRALLRAEAHAIAEVDSERDRPSDVELEQFVKLANRVRSRIEDELTKCVLAEDHRTRGTWARSAELADPRDGTAGEDFQREATSRHRLRTGLSQLDAQLLDTVHEAFDSVPEWREALELFQRDVATPEQREMIAVYEEVFVDEDRENVSEMWRRFRSLRPETAPSRRTFADRWDELKKAIREFAA